MDDPDFDMEDNPLSSAPTGLMETPLSPLLESRRDGPVTPNYGSQSNSMISSSVGHNKSNYKVFDPLT